jgi:hypothetical protein
VEPCPVFSVGFGLKKRGVAQGDSVSLGLSFENVLIDRQLVAGNAMNAIG